MYCAYVSGNTVVYAVNDYNNYTDGNQFKTYNLKTGTKKTIYKGLNEQGAFWMSLYNKGYIYGMNTGEAGWGSLCKMNIQTGKIKEVNLGVKYNAYSQSMVYKQYIVLIVNKNESLKTSTLCVYNTSTRKSKKIASRVTGVNIFAGKLYYAVSGKLSDEGIGNATLYRCSIKGTGKKKIASLKNAYTHSLAISKTSVQYYNANEKLKKYTYSSKKISAGSSKTHNKVRRVMEGYY